MKSKFVSTTFGKIAYEDCGGGENTLVFLHGGAANLRAWDGVVQSLGKKHRCISIDLPAHGRTPIKQLPFDELNDALLEFCDSLSINQPFLIGHSFGGLVAATTASRHARRFTAVMAIDPYLTNQEVRGAHRDLAHALAKLQNIKWPWMEVRDLDNEVERCHSNLNMPRRYPESTKAMIRRGFRLQESGTYIRYPRREDEMKGVEANWSIDIDSIYEKLPCPLCIVIASSGLPNIKTRKAVVSKLDSAAKNFRSIELECEHDIPGFLPEELGDSIDEWVSECLGS